MSQHKSLIKYIEAK